MWSKTMADLLSNLDPEARLTDDGVEPNGPSPAQARALRAWTRKDVRTLVDACLDRKAA
jgi:hypothetical protein